MKLDSVKNGKNLYLNVGDKEMVVEKSNLILIGARSFGGEFKKSGHLGYLV